MRLSTLTFIAAALLPVLPVLAQDLTYVPERRLVLTENTDFYGSDLKSIFDTTLDRCV